MKDSELAILAGITIVILSWLLIDDYRHKKFDSGFYISLSGICVVVFVFLKSIL